MNFADTLRDCDEMLYQGRFDKFKPTFEAAWKAWNISLAAKPKSNIAMSHTWTKEQEWDATKDAATEKVKNATKLSASHHDLKFDNSFANDKWSFKLGHPLLKEKDDWNVSATAMTEQNPIKNSYKYEVTTAIKSPDMSGSKLNMNVAGEYNEKAEVLMKFDAQLNYQNEWMVGAAFEHLTSNEKDAKVGMKDVAAHVVYRDAQSARYWLSYSQFWDSANLGCYQKYTGDKDFSHAYEARYSLKENDTSGFMNSPLKVAAGGKYVLSKASAMTYGVQFGNSFVATAKFDHKLDNHWKLRIAQQFDNNRTGKRPKYDLGFDINYTL